MRKLISLCALPFAFLAVGIMRGLFPYKLIRIGEIWSSRLGHLMGNTEAYLSERDSGIQPPDAYDIFFHVGKPCNKVIARKYDKLLHIWPAWFCILVVRVNCLFQGWEKYLVKTSQVERDIHNIWRRAHIGFTKAEERRGEALLRKLGIPEGAKWVCLIVRDNAYMSAKFPTGNWSYHDYRDADIENYMFAAQNLIKRGYYVIRMGEVVSGPLPLKHTKLIDYTQHRTELGDLYLGAKCDFCLGTPCGFMMIPQVFQGPLCMTDFVPIEYFTTFADGLLIWKHHIKDGKEMTIREIAESDAGLCTFTHLFAQAGITLKNNTPQEINDVAMEMADRTLGIFPNIMIPEIHESYKAENAIQKEFWRTFPRSVVNGKPLHGKIHVRIGREFLKAYNEKT